MQADTIIASVLTQLILFLKHVWGSIHTPYQTYRKLAKGEHVWQALPIGVLTVLYFSWSTLVHHGIRTHPFFLTVSFTKVVLGSLGTFGVVLVSLVVVGRLVGGGGGVGRIFLPWSYSLLPTLLWFFTTSMLTLLLPPPRTTSIPGQVFSFLFVVFSLFLFFWKGVLYYLTLRFGMRLDLFRIVIASVILFPLGALYALIMYKLGIFRIPFV
ncbi:hypothetical protein HY468_02985 [Candidatus Roizmanbacteria bacterium]|nr:hypothetical protein [Candidatus Roizmanbacteria bacterium]